MLKKLLKEEELLEHVNDTAIFNKYFGEFDFTTNYHSVFRKDENPSTGFYLSEKGRIIYNDLHPEGDSYNSVAFVMKKYGLTYSDALKKIWNEMVMNKEGKEKALEFKDVVLTKESTKKEIAFIPNDDFSEEEMTYWSDYGITKEELKENLVYSVKKVFSNGKMMASKKGVFKFAYRIKHKDDWYLKIYTPSLKKYKWFGPVPLTCPFGWEELPYKSDTLIITKSQKDRIILKKYFTDVIALQNESMAALTKEMVDLINQRYNRVIINFDADKAGKKACSEYVEAYDWECFSTPDNLYEEKKIKDCSDLVKEFGLDVFERYLKKEGLLK